jgi:uncharacterized repeat protein (TIGR03803 family)
VKGTFLLVLVIALLAGSAFGARTQPVVVFTFVCNGDPSLGVGTCPNGAGPNSLIQGSDGNFYGTARFSAEGELGPTAGTVFSLTPAGKFTLLHAFLPGADKNFANGAHPTSLVEGHDGNLYGITSGGGNPPGSVFASFGVVFRISKTGSNFRVIHKFCSTATCSDGGGNSGALVVGKDGNIYGATYQGGSGSGCGQQACGTIFRVAPFSGVYQVVASFDFSTDGEIPQGLAPAPDGTFYGISNSGGKLFHFTPGGGLQATALPFIFPKGCPGFACFASGVLAVGQNGNVYGYYTVYGSPATGIFEVQPDGSNLKLFAPSGSGLILPLASDGNFWIPNVADSTGNGNILAVAPSDGSVLRTLTPFSPSSAAGTVPSWLIQAKDGTLWGMTNQGGKAGKNQFGAGTIYSLKLGLPPN